MSHPGSTMGGSTFTLIRDRGDMIRDVLLGVYALGWLIVIVVTIWRKGEVDPLLWAALGGGVGVIMGIFRAEGSSQPKKDPSPGEEKVRD